MVESPAQVVSRPFALSQSRLMSKVLLCAASVAGYAIFSWVGKTFHLPSGPREATRLFVLPGVGIKFCVVLTAFILCVLIGTLIAGRVRFDGGLLCGAIGLVALSIRGGTVADALRTAVPPTGPPRIFLIFAGELVAWYAIVTAGFAVLWLLHRQGWLQRDSVLDELEDVDESPGAKVTALAAQIVFSGVGMLLLLQSDAKSQTELGIGCACYVGALAAHSLFPVRPSVWFWIGPLIVGMAMYIWAYFASPQWAIGIVGIEGKFFGPSPARALPIDFAGAGTAGTLIGYWLSRKLHRGTLLEAEQTEAS